MIIEKKRKKYYTISKNNSEILYLLINRWVGIDGVMAVSSKEEILSKKFFPKMSYTALKDKKREKIVNSS